jgi:hypothetical protein
MTDTGWFFLYAFFACFTVLTLPMWFPVVLAMWDDFTSLWREFLKGDAPPPEQSPRFQHVLANAKTPRYGTAGDDQDVILRIDPDGTETLGRFDEAGNFIADGVTQEMPRG